MNRFKSFRNRSIICFVLLASIFLTSCFPVRNRFKVPDKAILLDAGVTDVYGNAGSAVTIISDDGMFVSGMYFNSLMKKYDLRGSVAGAVCYIEPHIEDWKEVNSQGHVEIVNHSYNQIKMSEESDIAKSNYDLKHEILDSKKYYEKQFNKDQIVFICPENTMCRKGYEILVKNGYWAVRKGERGFNSLSPEEGFDPGQWYNLKCYGIMDPGVDTDVRNGWVDSSIKDHVWLIEMWHNVVPEDDGYYQTILVDEAMQHLEYIKQQSDSNSIWVATITEAVKYFREKQNSNVTAYIIDNELHIMVELTDKNMSYDVFDQPLTVNVNMPSGENQIFDVVPGRETVVDLEAINYG